MSISIHRIFHSFGPETTLGQIVDTVADRLGSVMWFRGESMEFDLPACPVLARQKDMDLSPIEPDYDDGIHRFPLRLLTKAEDSVVQALQSSPPYDPYFSKLLSNSNHPGWLALARHHGKPTRLLDVTRDLFVALFFACTENQDKDGLLFAFLAVEDPEKNHPGRLTDYKDIFDPALGDHIPSYREHEKLNPGILQREGSILLDKFNSPRRDMIYLYRCQDVINERMQAQRGSFIWRGDPAKSLYGDIKNVFLFKIAAASKAGIVLSLNKLGINSATLALE